MARNTKSRGKIVRRLGTNVYGLRKYDRLLRKKPQGPGMGRGEHSRKKVSEYGRQLVEKQKLRYSYGLSEKQFYNTFQRAKKRKEGLTGNNFLILLETRLDNVIYRLNWGNSRSQARQIVSHGHVCVNGRRVNIPSVTLRVGDKITVKDSDVSRKLVRESMTHNTAGIPAWLELKADDLLCEMKREPTREDIPSIANEQMIVEYYSR
ncbi:MAG: 30S ribosomal protein S4 [Spirochaetota bacterium]